MPHPRKSQLALEVTDSDPRWSERAPSELTGGRAKLPPGLSEEARRHFRRISKLLGARQHESPADGELIAAYARTYVDLLECRALVTREGRMTSEIVLTSNGVPVEKRKPHPMLREIASCESRLAALLRDLGLTLTLRDRVKKPGAPPIAKGKKFVKRGSYAWDLFQENPEEARRIYPNLIFYGR